MGLPKLGSEIDESLKSFSKEDLELALWLETESGTFLDELGEFLSSCFFNDFKTKEFYENKCQNDRKRHSVVIVHELKEYAGHTLNLFASKPVYPQILSRVHKRLSKHYKKKNSCPDIASVNY